MTQKQNLSKKILNNKKSYAIGMFFLLFFTLIFTSSTSAAPDNELTYHGKLTDTSNTSVPDGNYDFKLSIYTVSSGGTPIWTARGTTGTPTSKSLTVTNGIFSTVLGESGDNSLDGITFDSNYYLGITIGTNSEMTPRRKITPTGFALNSNRLNGLTADNYIDTSATNQTKLGGLTLGDDFTVNTDDFHVDTTAGRVGIGTTSPNEVLQVSGAINVGNTTNTNAGTIRYNGSDLEGYNGSSWISLTAAGAWTQSGGNIYRSGGNVGISDVSPDSLFTINNNYRVFSGSESITSAGIGTTNSIYLGRFPTGMHTVKVYYQGHSGYNSSEIVIGKDYDSVTPDNAINISSWKKSEGAGELTSLHHDWHDNDETDVYLLFTHIAPSGESINVQWSVESTSLIAVTDPSVTPPTLDGSNEIPVQMFVDASGDVGIGTTSPGYKLDVNGNASVTTLNTGQGNYELYAMNQDVLTTSDVQFDGLTIGTNSQATETDIKLTANANISTGSSMHFFIDDDNTGTVDNFYWKTNAAFGAGTTLMSLNESGTLTVNGNIDMNNNSILDTALLSINDNTAVPDVSVNADKEKLLQLVGANGGLWQVSGRGGLMLSSADDALILANGDVGRSFDTSVDPDNESMYLLSDADFIVKTDLQEGFGTEHTLRLSNAGDFTLNGNTIWHAGNDGSTSTLDAHFLDGLYQTSANVASTIMARNSNGDTNVRYLNSSYVNMSHSVTTRNSDTVFYSSTDGYIRKNNATGMRTSLGLGSAATRNAEDTLTNGSNLPDGAAITSYVTGLGYITNDTSVPKNNLVNSGTLPFDWADSEIATSLTLETINGTPRITNGVRIGTDDTNHLIDELSNGLGSSTLYIGNESILASGDIGSTVQGYNANTTLLGSTIALGTETSGTYVGNVTGGTAITVSGTPAEGYNETVSITAGAVGDTQLAYNTGQHLTTASSPTFNNIYASGRVYVDNTTNYLSYPTGNYGSVQVNATGAGGWEGYSIDGRYVMMSDDTGTVGLYNDVDNRWVTLYERNSYYRIYEPDSGNVAMHIDNLGNIGLGTTSPDASLHIMGGEVIESGNGLNAYLDFHEAGALKANIFWNGANDKLVISDKGYSTVLNPNTGYVGIRNYTPIVPLDVNGTIEGDVVRTAGRATDCPAGWSCTGYFFDMSIASLYYNGLVQRSDIRLKENINNLDDSIVERLLLLNPISYNWKDRDISNEIQYGLIAQEVEEIFPELVSETEDGMKSVNYMNLLSPIIEATQQQQNSITTNANNIILNATATSVSELQTLTEQQFTDTNETLKQVQDDILALQQEANKISNIQSDIELVQAEASLINTLFGIDETTNTTDLALQMQSLLTVDTEKLIFTDTDTDGNTTLTLEGILTTQTLKAENIETNTLTVNDNITIADENGDEVNASSIGTATILVGETEVIVETTKAVSESQIFVTAKTYLEQPLFISEIIDGKSFTVSVASAVTDNIEFSWFIVD